MRLLAPAKLNLYLRVLGKRPDGYHELETVFERVDLADELTFEPAGTLQLTCSDPTLSCGEDNLVLRAARALQHAANTTAGARMHLIKRIPIAAGLGGGSSDAAAALRGLAALWQVEADEALLHRLAAALGSDVPFFLQSEPFALGLGRGERLTPLVSQATLDHVLVVPDAKLSTKDIYEAFDQARFDPSTQPPSAASLRIVPSEPLDSASGLARGKCRAKSRHERSESRDDLTMTKPSRTMVEHALRNGSLSELAKGLWNDLEPEAIRRCPVISAILLQLNELGCVGARVSGSGPSVFGLCRDTAQARTVAEGLRRTASRRWRVELLKTMHPEGRVAVNSA